jgi:LacI family transcriptional regulator
VSGVFACLSSSAENIEVYQKMNDRDIPVVFFDIVPKDNKFTKVRMADERCAIMAAENIIKRNAKKVLAIFGDENLSITQKRKAAFQKFMQDFAPKIHCSYTNAASTKEAEEVMKKITHKTQKIDTVFCMTDEILIGVMRTIQELELKIPTDIGVISISNGFIPNLYYPRISYVETSGHELGKLAFVQMMANMKGGKTLTELTVEAKFIAGGSM